MKKHLIVSVLLLGLVAFTAHAQNAVSDVAAAPAPAAAPAAAVPGAPAKAEVAATAASTKNTQNCAMHEEGQVNVNFNMTETDVTRIKNLVDAKMQDILDTAKQLSGTTVDVQSFNYSANSTGNNTSCGNAAANASVAYQVYGNVSVKVTPAGNAATLTPLLTARGYNVNFNVNSYRQCGAQEGGE